MKSVRCYLVKVKELISISDKAYKAVGHDGSTAILPKSQVIMPGNCENEWWVSCWIMDEKELQHSKKIIAWANAGTYTVKYEVQHEHHIPKPLAPLNTQADAKLIR